MTLEVLTGLLVIITAVYAVATFRILRANQQAVEVMREQADALSRPYVAIAPFTAPRSHLFRLRIANTGKTAAKSLRLTIDRDFYQYGESRNLAAMSAFTEPIDSFPPGAELIFGLEQGQKLFAEEVDEKVTPTRFRITARYSYFGKTVTETTEVDLRPHAQAMPEPSPLLEELEKIRKTLEKYGVPRAPSP